MNRKERTASIILELDECAERFCKSTGGMCFELESQYKGREEIENIKYRQAYIFYNSFLVEFKYTKHATFGLVSSILECMIHTDKNKYGFSIPLALLLDYCEIGTAIPLCVPGIFDSDGMREAFELISGVLEDNMQTISEILGDTDRRSKVESAFFSEMSAIYNTVIDKNNVEFYVDAGLCSFFTLRFCSSAFINYIKGDVETAVKQLKKVKNKMGYEQRVLKLWESGEKADLSRLSSVQASLESYNKSGVAGTNKKETIVMFLSWFVLCIAFSAVYIGLFFLLLAIEKINTVYLMGPIYNFPYCILAGFLSAIPASYFTRFKFYKWIFPRDYEKFRASDQMNNGKSGEKVIKVLFHIIVICSLIGTILFTRWGIKFLDGGFVDNTKFLSVSGQYYEYDELERVYYMPNRVNGFGETLDFPSYVLVLKDGHEIDLYEYGDIEEYEEPLMNHLRENGVRVENVPNECEADEENP